MNIDLSHWKLQLPIDAKGTFRGKAAEVLAPASYSNPDYFHVGNGGIVLAAPVNGATTGGSVYARSELREMSGPATICPLPPWICPTTILPNVPFGLIGRCVDTHRGAQPSALLEATTGLQQGHSHRAAERVGRAAIGLAA